jgi:hypothetical protein
VNHLTHEQLSARLDQALKGRAAEEVERHLASCESCRAALAELVAQEAALRPALTGDPGEAYFENFAARVDDRIRAAGLAGAQGRRRSTGFGRLWGSPRSLAWVGAVATVVVAAGLALLTGRDVRPPDLRDRDIATRVERQAPAGDRRDQAAGGGGPPPGGGGRANGPPGGGPGPPPPPAPAGGPATHLAAGGACTAGERRTDPCAAGRGAAAVPDGHRTHADRRGSGHRGAARGEGSATRWSGSEPGARP